MIISDLTSSNTEIHIHFSLPRKVSTCPHCHGLTDQVHDYPTSIIKDLPLMGKQTFLHYRKRRYHCPHCGKHFYEPFPFAAKHCRTTTRLLFYSEYYGAAEPPVRCGEFLESMHYCIGILNRRRKKSSTIFCSQYDCNGWYDQLGGDDSPLSEAILDRIKHDAYKINIIPTDPANYRSMREVYGLDPALSE